jgi:hypothetical protein
MMIVEKNPEITTTPSPTLIPTKRPTAKPTTDNEPWGVAKQVMR